ncbi:MAG: hypothetical protein [Wendovervirus sonii]|uniref:Uncharacterized protein n=1 Tax=phage Lak_Megaphage_Sonny TaxID=3109229 RepID=A0ABZ0Z4V3_9CAUD|nr:MAG: hypothetical protein [phage Lak_Megaphage_Sonny]
MKKILKNLISIFKNAFFKEHETGLQQMINDDNGPVALDIFGNYIYLGDDVIPIAYNDKRNPYITVKVGFETYKYASTAGPINRNVIKQTVFFEKYKEGKVLISRSGDFYHVERQVSAI